jgi:hypothetical protein
MSGLFNWCAIPPINSEWASFGQKAFFKGFCSQVAQHHFGDLPAAFQPRSQH